MLLEIPSSIVHLRRLETLNLSSNQLVSLPTEIGKLQALRVVDVSDNQLTHLPSSIGELRVLEQLGARRNRITVFPRLQYCASLKELHLGGNQIHTIDRDAPSSLGSLVILELRNNGLKSLPTEIQQLSSLVRLDLSNNELNNLPYSLGNIRTLKALSLEGNPLECITKKAFLHSGTEEVLQYLRDRMEEASLEGEDDAHSAGDGNDSTNPSMESNNASMKGLTEKEKQIMTVTKFLDYSNRQVDDIPDEVLCGALECRVHTMKLNRNYFTTIPTRLKDFLHLLVELDLSYNRLCDLPSFIGYSPHLQVLDIQDNQLNSLPPEMVNLKQLLKLNISHNRFSILPEVVYNMPWLEMLFAANNHINNLDPEGLIQMKNLKVLDLVNNDIKHLPPQLGLLEQLRRLQLFGNPFRQPRANIINRGTASVLEWLRDRLPTTTIETSLF